MKKILSIVLIVSALLTGMSCRRATDNGKIDGHWQIREIQYNDGTTSYPTTRYIAIQLELLQLRGPAVVTGVLDYHKNSSELGVDFRYKPTDSDLYPYGFAIDPATSGTNTSYCKLTIETVNSHALVLRSPIAVITCRRY